MSLLNPRLNILAIILATVLAMTWVEILEPFFAAKWLLSSGLLYDRSVYRTLLVPIVAAIPVAVPFVVYAIFCAVRLGASSVGWVMVAGVVASPVGYLLVDDYSRVAVSPGRTDYFYLSFLAPILFPLLISILIFYLTMALISCFRRGPGNF